MCNKSKTKNIFLLSFVFFSVLFSCKRKPNYDNLKQYIFLGHIYRCCVSNRVDKRVEKIDFSKYDKIMLGGDVCVESSKEKSTLQYIDSLFDISSPDTYWAIGNHDVTNGNPDFIEEFTGKNLFYADYTNGITIFVLDTYLEENRLNEQFNLFTKVCDTIQKSSHLLLLMHNVVWDSVSTQFNGDDFANGNYPHWHCRTNPYDYFYHSMYPKLKEVQDRGINVMCISGDLGQREKRYFDFISSEGIELIGSGIDNSNSIHEKPDDYILILKHDLKYKTIIPEFHNLNEFKKTF